VLFRSVPDWLTRLEHGRSRSIFFGIVAALFRPDLTRDSASADGNRASYGRILQNFLNLMVPLALTGGTFAATWWYVVIYNAPSAQVESAPAGVAPTPQTAAPPAGSRAEEKPQELGEAESELKSEEPQRGADAPPEEMTIAGEPSAQSAAGKVPAHFFDWFWGLAAASALLLAYYYWRMDGEQFEILKELSASVVPLGVLTVVVLAVILFGICTATESAAVGALGALYLAVIAKFPRQAYTWSVFGVIGGVALGWAHANFVELIVSGSLGATFAGTVIPIVQNLKSSPELRQNLKESTFLTAKTTAMVCWLFIGSALFSAVFALHGGQSLIERWVLSMNLSPLGFQFMAQLIIFLLGWPLEWTEIIVIFCPIFIPLLSHFQIDPILFGTMVAVNLQAAFLSPPVAMSAFYLKGVSPPHVTLNQIFAGMMPYMIIVCLCLAFMYIWPGMTLWLPEFLYGN